MVGTALPQINSGASQGVPHWIGPATYTMLAGLVLIVLCFLPGVPYRLEQYDLPKDVILGVMGFVCALQLLSIRQSIRDDWLRTAPAVFLGLGLLVTVLSRGNHVAAWRTMGLFSAAAAVFLLAYGVGRYRSPARLYWGAIFVLGAMCVLVLLEAYGGIPFLSAPGRRPGGTLGNRNLAARLACLMLPLLWNRFVVADQRVIQGTLLVLLSGTVAVVVLSRSRGAFLVTCALVVILPLATRWCCPSVNRRDLRIMAFLWTAAVVIGVIAAVLAPNHLGWKVEDFAYSARRIAEYQNGTGRGRVIQMETTWRMIRENPLLGVGPGNWSVVYPAYAADDDPSVVRGAFYPGPQIPRNDVLAMTAEWGVVGISAGVAFLVTLFGRVVRLLTSSSDKARVSGVMVFGVLVATTMLGLFDSVLRVAPTIVVLVLLIGLGLGEGEVSNDVPQADAGRLPGLGWKIVLSAYAIASFAFARNAAQDINAIRIIGTFRSTKDLARAVNAAPNNVEARALLSYVLVTAGRCDLAAPHLTRAAQLQPYSIFIERFQERCSYMKDP